MGNITNATFAQILSQTKQLMAIKRVKFQLNNHELCPADGVRIDSNFLTPTQANHKFVLTASIVGPQKTPYQGGLFKLSIQLPTDYPFRKPRIKFITKIYHPCVHNTGSISVQWLLRPFCKYDWSPAITIEQTLLLLRDMLAEHDPEYFLNAQIAQQYDKKRGQFNKTAAQWCQKYAI